MNDLIKRRLSDHQRMLWKDEVHGVCPDVSLCFEHGDHARCGPCAIKLADAAGVETDFSIPDLPEVYRLRRRITAMKAAGLTS